MKSHKYKILFLASWYPSRLHPISGIFIKRHAEAVSKFCDVAVLYVTLDPNLKDKVYDVVYTEEDGIPTVRVYYRKPNIKIRLIPRLLSNFRYIKGGYLGLEVIKEKFGRPKITHVNVITPAWILAFILKVFKGIPYIITEHNDIYLRIVKNLYKINSFILCIEKYIVKHAECYIVDSSAIKNSMIQLGFDNKCYVIPNVVEEVEVNYDNIKLDKQRKHTKKRAIHISLLADHQKNISGIISALRNEKLNQNMEFHIVGDGIHKKNLEELAEKYGLLNKVIFFHGRVSEDEKRQLLLNSDFHILNSYYEGFSVSTIEALMCGIPVIATKCGGPEDFVTEEVGTLIEPGNQKQLEEAIIYMLDNSEKYDRKKLQEYAKSKFSYEVVGRQLYQIYA